ncbi:MAG: peptidase M64, partial [Muribaculaceae bacterium]|nr:peptidase M64 [Muribaculaceae bacterium]
MRLKRIVTSSFLALVAAGMNAADFNQNFSDSTLRVDYIFGGGPDGLKIMLDSQSKQGGWAGRRTRLEGVPVAGNGTVMVTDPV